MRAHSVQPLCEVLEDRSTDDLSYVNAISLRSAVQGDDQGKALRQRQSSISSGVGFSQSKEQEARLGKGMPGSCNLCFDAPCKGNLHARFPGIPSGLAA